MQMFPFVMGSIALVMQLYANFYREEDLRLTLSELELDSNVPRIKVYDFIVVGGGAGGCVMANRLSAQYKVLLLEAGGNPVPAADVPAFYQKVAAHPLINYKYKSVPQRYAALANGGIITKMPGKMLGGSASHNGLIVNRGSPHDFDAWAEITGDSSWKYENVLKYFKKAERFVGEGGAGQHGTDGPITVTTGAAPIIPKWFAAGTQLGFKTSIDPNGPQAEGFTGLNLAIDGSQRVSPYTAYIKAHKNGKKLTVERYSVVSEVLIDARKSAYGVAYYRHGIPQIAHASKTVIVSAGNYATPLLLMKSGIGPAQLLNAAKIPVIADLPVGKGVQDHTAVAIGPFTVNDTTLFPRITRDLTQISFRDFHASKPNSLLTFGPLAALAFIVSSRAKAEGQRTWPDYLIAFEDGFSADTDPHEIWFHTVLGRPRSRGLTTFNTTAYVLGERDDEKLALIDYNILSDPSDTDVLVEGLKLGLKIAESTAAFQGLGAVFKGAPILPCASLEFRSDAYWNCYVHQVGTTWIHFASACRMGFGPRDKTAVLDAKLNVLGVSNLKVVDASAMPSITNANLVAPIVMMAEKVADEMLNQYRPNN